MIIIKVNIKCSQTDITIIVLVKIQAKKPPRLNF